MITLALSAHVGAARETAWRALVEPEQVLRWRPGAFRLVEAPRGRLGVGDALRIRCRLRDVAVLLDERVLEAESGRRLRTQVRFGLFRFEASYSLADAPGSRVRTRVGLRITTASEAPLFGGSLDRFAVRRFATQLAAVHLEALRDWCELHPLASHGVPAPPGAATAAGA